MALGVAILAAGRGTRMCSRRPKVLHEIGGKPLLEHVYRTASALHPERIYIVYSQEEVLARFPDWPVVWVKQEPQLGTGHAVMQLLPHLREDLLLVLYGDVPLLRPETLSRLIGEAAPRRLVVLTARVENPEGYGRIVRDRRGRIERIVETRTVEGLPEEILEIDEVNTGIMLFQSRFLREHLPKLTPDNRQREYYLTDLVEVAVREGVEVVPVVVEDEGEAFGINDKRQLARAEGIYQRRMAERLMERGVTLRDPDRFLLRGEIVQLGLDVEIDVGVVLEGRIALGDGVKIGAYAVLRDVQLEEGVEVLPYSHLVGVKARAGAKIGPFARLRPETVLAEQVQIGNFVEVKNSRIGAGTKINHLAYVGDSEVGSQVNIGAGTITCNYDGFRKQKTIIEDGVFIGSDCQLIAPVRIGRGAIVGAGSTITHDVDPDVLVLSRTAQRVVGSASAWRERKRRGR